MMEHVFEIPEHVHGLDNPAASKWFDAEGQRCKGEVFAAMVASMEASSQAEIDGCVLRSWELVRERNAVEQARDAFFAERKRLEKAANVARHAALLAEHARRKRPEPPKRPAVTQQERLAAIEAAHRNDGPAPDVPVRESRDQAIRANALRSGFGMQVRGLVPQVKER